MAKTTLFYDKTLFKAKVAKELSEIIETLQMITAKSIKEAHENAWKMIKEVYSDAEEFTSETHEVFFESANNEKDNSIAVATIYSGQPTTGARTWAKD